MDGRGVVHGDLKEGKTGFAAYLYGVLRVGGGYAEPYGGGKAGGEEGKKAKLNTLGTQEWTKTRERVRSAVGVVAKDLVELYARRQNGNGYVYGPDTVWQKEFEETFPYEETEGQLRPSRRSNRI